MERQRGRIRTTDWPDATVGTVTQVATFRLATPNFAGVLTTRGPQHLA